MIWLGYAGFSGAIVISIAMLASIIGVQTDVVLSIAARAAGALLVLGVSVHLVALMMRRRPKAPARAPIAVVRAAPSAVQAIKRVDPAAKPVATQTRGPGAANVLWPEQPAH